MVTEIVVAVVVCWAFGAACFVGGYLTGKQKSR